MIIQELIERSHKRQIDDCASVVSTFAQALIRHLQASNRWLNDEELKVTIGIKKVLRFLDVPSVTQYLVYIYLIVLALFYY